MRDRKPPPFRLPRPRHSFNRPPVQAGMPFGRCRQQYRTPSSRLARSLQHRRPPACCPTRDAGKSATCRPGASGTGEMFIGKRHTRKTPSAVLCSPARGDSGAPRSAWISPGAVNEHVESPRRTRHSMPRWLKPLERAEHLDSLDQIGELPPIATNESPGGMSETDVCFLQRRHP